MQVVEVYIVSVLRGGNYEYEELIGFFRRWWKWLGKNIANVWSEV
jgi:hypothetical protein